MTRPAFPRSRSRLAVFVLAFGLAAAPGPLPEQDRQRLATLPPFDAPGREAILALRAKVEREDASDRKARDTRIAFDLVRLKEAQSRDGGGRDAAAREARELSALARGAPPELRELVERRAEELLRTLRPSGRSGQAPRASSSVRASDSATDETSAASKPSTMTRASGSVPE